MKSTLTIIIFFLSQQIFSQTAFWKDINSYYPNWIYDFTVDKNGYVFLATENTSYHGAEGGIYRTTNNGASWEHVGLIKAFSLTSIGDTIFAQGSPSKDQYYVNNLYVSADNGNNWKLAYNNFFGGKILIDDNKYLYTIDGSNNLYMSIDNGTTWGKMNNVWGNTRITAWLSYGGNIFIGTAGKGVYRSTDLGYTWTGGGTAVVSSIVENNNALFIAAERDCIYSSSDLGSSWTNINFTNSSCSSLSVYKNILYAIVDSLLYPYSSKIYKSSDNGLTWLQSGSSAGNTIFFDKEGYLFSYNKSFGGDEFGLINRSSDFGFTWFNSSTHNWVTTFLNLTSNEFIIGTLGNYIFKTNNSGASYLQLSNGITNPRIITSIRASNGDIFLGTDGDGVFHSTDEGNNWFASNNGLGSNTYVYALIAGNNGELLSACNPNGYDKGFVYRSTDNGQSWQLVLSASSNIYSICTDSSNYIFAGAMYGNLYRSTDNGRSWELHTTFSNSPNIRALVTMSNGVIFAGNDYPGGLWKTTNHGENWRQLGFTNVSVTSLMSDKAFNIWIGTFGNGVFESTDEGVTWKQTNTGLMDTKITSLTITLEGNLLAGASSSGIYMSNNPITSFVNESAYQINNYSLSQNFPNPFNPTTTINYSVPKLSFVTIKVYDILGKEVTTLINEEKNPGNYTVQLIANDLASGAYFLRMIAGDYIETKKLILVK